MFPPFPVHAQPAILRIWWKILNVCLLSTGLQGAGFERWPRVDPSSSGPSHVHEFLDSWRGCCFCRWGGHLCFFYWNHFRGRQLTSHNVFLHAFPSTRPVFVIFIINVETDSGDLQKLVCRYVFVAINSFPKRPSWHLFVYTSHQRWAMWPFLGKCNSTHKLKGWTNQACKSCLENKCICLWITTLWCSLNWLNFLNRYWASVFWL